MSHTEKWNEPPGAQDPHHEAAERTNSEGDGNAHRR